MSREKVTKTDYLLSAFISTKLRYPARPLAWTTGLQEVRPTRVYCFNGNYPGRVEIESTRERIYCPESTEGVWISTCGCQPASPGAGKKVGYGPRLTAHGKTVTPRSKNCPPSFQNLLPATIVDPRGLGRRSKQTETEPPQGPGRERIALLVGSLVTTRYPVAVQSPCR